MNLDATRFLEDLTGRHARAYTDAVTAMVVAMATGSKTGMSAARTRMNEVMRETMGTAEILGASIALRDAARVLGEDALNFRYAHQLASRLKADRPFLMTFATTPTQTIIPRVTFSEAVEDMVSRTPVTIRNAAERTAQKISELYGEGRNVAFVRSAEQAVTKRVQSLISQAIKEGITEVDIGRGIVKDVDFIRTNTDAWSEGYSRMVFRTNLNTAVTAGRFRQAQDPDIKRVMPGFEFSTAGDVDVRIPNHSAGDGIILSVDDKAWRNHAPPLGYNCRCDVRQVGLPELRRMGRVDEAGNVRFDTPPAAWGPDVGFRTGGRPDLLMNEATS